MAEVLQIHVVPSLLYPKKVNAKLVICAIFFHLDFKLSISSFKFFICFKFP